MVDQLLLHYKLIWQMQVQVPFNSFITASGFVGDVTGDVTGNGTQQLHLQLLEQLQVKVLMVQQT